VLRQRWHPHPLHQPGDHLDGGGDELRARVRVPMSGERRLARALAEAFVPV
jgi:hypothetical protein